MGPPPLSCIKERLSAPGNIWCPYEMVTPPPQLEPTLRPNQAIITKLSRTANVENTDKGYTMPLNISEGRQLLPGADESSLMQLNAS